MNLIKNKKGYTETELMMVFALVALLGILCFTLIQAGSGAYSRLADNRSNKAFARVALSYIENRVRQGDQDEAIWIANSPVEKNEQVLIITGITGVEGEELWILKKDNQLVEYYVSKGAVFDAENYFEIADIESFEVKRSGGALILNIGYYQGEEIKTQSRIIALRSWGGAVHE